MRTFGDPQAWPDQDLVVISDTASPELILQGYREGVFPMPVEDVIGWFSPLRRAILPLDGLTVRRSLRKTMRRYRCTLDVDFVRVMRACADPRRPNGWITPAFVGWYSRLHRLGYAHSIEVWDDAGRLVGGLYGVRVGKLFCGESMFHDPTHGRDASKTALVRLVAILQRGAGHLLDVQWRTDHLASLGADEILRADYLLRATTAAQEPGAPWPQPSGGAALISPSGQTVALTPAECRQFRDWHRDGDRQTRAKPDRPAAEPGPDARVECDRPAGAGGEVDPHHNRRDDGVGREDPE